MFDRMFIPFIILLSYLIVLPLIFRNPLLGIVLCIGLYPFHQIISMYLYGVAGLRDPWMTLFSAWKEILLTIVFLSVFWKSITLNEGELFAGSKLAKRLDRTILLLSIWVVILGVIGFLTDPQLSIKQLIWGLKSYFIMFFSYWSGRFISLNEQDIKKLFHTVISVGLITSIFVFFEFYVIDPELWRELGFYSYVSDYLQLGGHTIAEGSWMGTTYGISMGAGYANLWRVIDDEIVRRAGSFYLSAQPFAISFIPIIPVAVYLCYDSSTQKFLAKMLIALCLLAIALYMTNTRASIIGILLGIVAVYFVVRKRLPIKTKKFFFYCSITGAVLGSTGYLFRTIALGASFSESSSVTRIGVWEMGWKNFTGSVLIGNGIGQVGDVAQRFAEEVKGGESIYFKFLIETGLVGGLLHVTTLFLVFLLAKSLLRANSSKVFSLPDGISMIVLAMTVAILFNGFVTIIWQQFFLSLMFWFLAGQLAQRSRFLKSR